MAMAPSRKTEPKKRCLFIFNMGVSFYEEKTEKKHNDNNGRADLSPEIFLLE